MNHSHRRSASGSRHTVIRAHSRETARILESRSVISRPFAESGFQSETPSGALSESRCRNSGDRGITLLETLVALTILAVVTVSVLTMFSYSTRLNSRAEDFTGLCSKAGDTMEELLALPWSSGGVDPALIPDVIHRKPAMGDGFEIRWEVEDSCIDRESPLPPGRRVTSAGEGNLKRIVVTVISRRKHGAGPRTISLVAYRMRD